MNLLWPNPADIEGISTHQGDALAKSFARRFGILTGGPGVGKTRTAAAALRQVIEQHGAASVAVAAPTGKAAVRMTEAMSSHGLEITATTIHRLLCVQRNGHDGKGWGFNYHAGNPLPQRFILVDECFPAGTLIDTPAGRKAIEHVQTGDEILNAFGVDRVAAIARKEVRRVVRIAIGKTEIFTSESHRFFTARGWVNASQLEPGDSLMETGAAVRLVRKGDCSSKLKKPTAKVLQSILLDEMAIEPSGDQSQNFHGRASRASRCWSQAVSRVGKSRSDSAEGKIREYPAHAHQGHSGKGIENLAAIESQTSDSGRQRSTNASSSSKAACAVGCGMEARGRGSNWRSTSRDSDIVQSGHRSRLLADCHRSRRHFSSRRKGPACRRTEGTLPAFKRLDGVEILESTDSRLDRFRDADGSLCFYDLKATRHPSFSVEGLLVHNCSMIGTGLGASLMSACAPGTHVLLTGDTGQLPPVEHGAPLRDLLAAGVPHGELTETWRNAGDIVKACAAIRAGQPWQPSESLDIENGKNLKHCETRLANHALKHLENLLGSVPAGIDPKWDVQVLCAIKENSNVCKESLNKRLQAMLNPGGERNTLGDFRLGDKVMNTSNGWSPVVDDSGKILKLGGEEVTDFVANGEIGKVVQLDRDAKRVDVMFESPTRTIAFRGGFIEQLELAYAVTVHKSQGSQWPVVVFMADDYRGARFVGCRELIYTALSRAQKLAVTIGRKATIDVDCRRVALVGRKTFLTEKIVAGLSEAKECVAA